MNIVEVCKKYDIENWTIVGGRVNVKGDVNLANKNLTSLDIFGGIPFGIVSGYFNCDDNNLTTLEYGPTYVGDDLSCYNNDLTSLEYCATYVGGHFYCNCNSLTNLKGGPSEVGGDYICDNNILTSLEGAPTTTYGDFDCSGNILVSLMYSPTEVGGYFDCSENKLTTLNGAPISVGDCFCCRYNDLFDFKYLPKIFLELRLNSRLDTFFKKYIKTNDNIELFNEFNIISGEKLNLKRLNKFTKYSLVENINTQQLKDLGYDI